MPKWSDLTTEQKNRLIHQRVMGASAERELCYKSYTSHGNILVSPVFIRTTPDGYHEVEAFCTICGWQERVYIHPEGGGIAEQKYRHQIPIPAYSTSLDAAWLVLRYITMSHPASDHLEIFTRRLFGTTWGDLSSFEVIDHLQDWTPDAICLAACASLGIVDNHGEIVEVSA